MEGAKMTGSVSHNLQSETAIRDVYSLCNARHTMKRQILQNLLVADAPNEHPVYVHAMQSDKRLFR